MRLYNEKEPTTKVIDVENYQTFNGLLNSKLLFIALIAFMVYTVANAVLSFLGGSYIIGGIDLVIHILIIVALFIFKSANKNIGEKFSTKGITLFQIAHAIKYVIVFVFLFVLIVKCIADGVDPLSEASKVATAAKSSTVVGEYAAAKKAKNELFWSYFGITALAVVLFVVVSVYYYAAMSIADGAKKYQEKGTHFWKELKFSAIYFFVTAGLLIGFGVLLATGKLDGILVDKLKNAKVLINNFGGGVTWFALISRAVLALVLIYIGVVLLIGAKKMNNNVTSRRVRVNIEDGAVVEDPAIEVEETVEENEEEQEYFVDSHIDEE